MSDKYDALEKLQSLYEKGILTEVEFKQEKEKILNHSNSVNVTPSSPFFGLPEDTYLMLIHLSAILAVFHLALGAAVAFVFWLLFKDKYNKVDCHGRMVFNWLLTLLGATVALSLVFFLIYGYTPYALFNHSNILYSISIALNLVNVVQAIIGAIKANSGTLWRYPLSIPFIPIPKI